MGVRRVPPRRRRPRRTVWGGLIWPALKVCAILLVVVVMGTVVANKIVRPFKLCSREGRETRRLASELQALKNENAELERKIEYLKTPRGIALEARKLGWVKPGEITLVLPPEDKRPGPNASE